tara:strand:- start:3831 stop:4241 length:411 start_codon:yes stop_codon:yes gene_type:complete
MALMLALDDATTLADISRVTLVPTDAPDADTTLNAPSLIRPADTVPLDWQSDTAAADLILEDDTVTTPTEVDVNAVDWTRDAEMPRVALALTTADAPANLTTDAVEDDEPGINAPALLTRSGDAEADDVAGTVTEA